MSPHQHDPYARRRRRMVDADIRARGVRDPAVIAALSEVPRERFVAPDWAEFAYSDRPLPIGEGQTISQPYIVALMIEAAEVGPADRVLEIGTGSGYAAAVASLIVAEVWTIERVETLGRAAAARLADLGYANVHVAVGDGTLGVPEHAPYDAIIVTAGGPRAPESLLAQLADDGRLVMPVGEKWGDQELLRFRRRGNETVEEDLGGVRFVPLLGKQGFRIGEP